jgi:membrane protease YdiL (CAAX protease family)
LSVRCPGCGVVFEYSPPECAACGTFIPGKVDRATPVVASSAADASGVVRRAQSGARGVMGVFLVSLASGVVASVAAHLGVSGPRLEVAMTAVFAFVALVCAFAARAELAPLLRTTGGWRGGLTALVGFGLMVAVGAVYFRAFRVFGFFSELSVDEFTGMGWPRWTTYVLVSVAPGVLEELTFRGYVMARLEPLLSPRETLVVQAALFSLLHLGPVVFPSHFGIGLVLGLVRRRTRSLYPSMAVHMGWNAMFVYAEAVGRVFP